ncbi:MAG: stage II sporulation protein D [Oscillospiraceae bacterium]|nr:stage II sporulation protein D [Oscillospiraceae bacterium]
MKKYLTVSLVLIFILFFFPWLWGEPVTKENSEPSLPLDEAKENIEQDGEKMYDAARMLTVLIDGKIATMDMSSYLMGVVRAEMPASFETEALKAQAVAARTYTLHKIENGGSERHPEADTCDDINCCKAYMDAAEAAGNWGTQAAIYEEKIRSAVMSTDGECILYEGSPVLAVFHSSSAGATMDAQDVWSGSLPYLKSVASPENEDAVPNYYSSSTILISELKQRLQEALPQAELKGNPSNWFTNMRQQENGTVTSLCVGGEEISGNQLRSILGLRSACFTMQFDGDSVTFSVTGYGHGVGMSQYGANVLAASGMDYREILAWYYTGTTVEKYR